MRVAPEQIPSAQIDDADQGDFEAGTRSGLKLALERQRARCAQQDANTEWDFAGKKIKRKVWCTDTAAWFLKQLSEVKNLNELMNRARFQLEWYQSVGKPEGDIDAGQIQFTGYFYPLFKARTKADAKYKYPIYNRPVTDRELTMYSRAQIAEGALKGKGLELAYLDNPVDPYLLEVQGSGALDLINSQGQTTHQPLDNNGQNGREYVSLGKQMRTAGIPEEYINLQGIRKYFNELHPEQWREFSDKNPSFVFFKKTQRGPRGAAGVGTNGR